MKQNYWIITDYPQIKTSELLDEMRQLQGVYCYLNNTELDKVAPPPKNVEIHKVKVGIEPDMLNKSYDDAIKEKVDFLNIRKCIILALEVFKINGEQLDVLGLTRSSTLDANGNAMSMYRANNGQFNILRNDRYNRHSSFGPRQQFPFLTPSLVNSEIKIEIEDKTYKVKVIEEVI